MAKRIRKSARRFTHFAKSRKFHVYTVDLRSTCVDSRCHGQTVKNLRRLACEFELEQSQRKSTQVGGQTKRMLTATRKVALTCESVWPRHKGALPFMALHVSFVNLRESMLKDYVK